MQIARTLRDYLEVAGFEVSAVGDGSAAVASARGDKPDLIVLDLGLPGMDGLDVARELRRTSTVPIVMLTARGEEADRIVGLELGADDYLVKPFSPKELVARVRAVLRRPPPVSGNDRNPGYERGRLAIDFEAVSVRVSGSPVRLTKREFELLRFLVENRNRVLSRDRLLERVWGLDRQVETRSVDVHVGRLRGKLGQAGRQIETVIGMGYRFVEEQTLVED